MTITLRSTKGSPLTHTELDNNFISLQEAADAVSGTYPSENGFWPDITSSTVVWRFRDRVFVGDAAGATGNRTGTQTAWPAVAADGPNWYLRDSTLAATSSEGLIAIAGLSRTSDQTGAGPTESIGGAFYCDADAVNSTGWGIYTEYRRGTSSSSGYGIEIDAKNMSADVSANPFSLPAGAYGAWIAGGGDSAYGGTPANPSTAAIVIKTNDHTWNTGIIFEATSITGTDGTSGTGIAMSLARGHIQRWYMTGGFKGFDIRSDVDNNSQNHAILAGNNALQFLNAASNRSAQVTHVGSGVNYVELVGSVTTSAVQVNAKGSDTNIDLALSGKGTGVLSFGAHTAIGSEALSGYITIKDSGGTTRKLAVVS